MFVVQINSKDTSCHTQACDATAQIQIYTSLGIAEEDIEIIEKDTFSPEYNP